MCDDLDCQPTIMNWFVFQGATLSRTLVGFPQANWYQQDVAYYDYTTMKNQELDVLDPVWTQSGARSGGRAC